MSGRTRRIARILAVKNALVVLVALCARKLTRGAQDWTDTEKSAFFFVTLLESLPIAVIRRFIGWFEDFGIPIGGVVINQAIDKSQVTEDSAEFIKNRVKMQDRYREEANNFFKNICGEIPLFEKEVRGIEMVGRVTDSLFQPA